MIARMNIRVLVAVPTILAASAYAATDLDRLLADAASAGHPVEGIAYGQRVRAVPVGPAGECMRVGLVYLDFRRGGTERIVNYDVCGERGAEVREVSPALPDDPAMRELVRMSVNGALAYGTHVADYQGYRVASRRNTAPDGAGCAHVDTVVSSDRLLVSHAGGRVCQRQERQ
jgi:hypothetical protein